jgi:hypothetical protein
VFKRSTPAASATSGVMSDVEGKSARDGRAQIAFWVLALAGAVLGAAIGWTIDAPWHGAAIGALAGALLGAVLGLLMFVWPLLRALWHWLTELTGAVGVLAAVTVVASLSGSWWRCLTFVALAGAGAAMGPVRRRVLAWVWCAIARHRLRVCFAAFIRARNHLDPGLAPLILLARPTPAGERVWVWLRTGLSVEALAERASMIAVACWASEVQVTPSRRFAALVRIDIARRDPLRLVVASPLADVPGDRAEPTTAGVDLSGLALDLDGVAEEPVTVTGGRR